MKIIIEVNVAKKNVKNSNEINQILKKAKEY